MLTDRIKQEIVETALNLSTNLTLSERFREYWYVVEDRRSGSINKFSRFITEGKDPIVSDLSTHYKVSFLLDNNTYWGLLIDKRKLEEINSNCSKILVK